MKKKCFILVLLCFLLLMLGACGNEERKVQETPIDFQTIADTGKVELDYATQFQIEKYGVYDVITIGESDRYLVVPEGEPVPGNLPEDMIILQQPLNHTYLVSTSAMDLIAAVDGIANIRLSGTRESDWSVTKAKEAMENKTMLYAGKYSMPDYEMILNEDCNLAIENTMIYHNPEVKEKLEEFGIPVLVERSSYESHPLGRLEWIKLYGVLFDKEAVADRFFEEQIEKIEPIMKKKESGPSVAFFGIMSNGTVSVRKPGDYITQMISLAGGSYILQNITTSDENALSTLNMQMEDFYYDAKEADILIYNSTIEGEIESISDLIARNAVFSDFKAVKNGNVYCTDNNFFQKITGTCDFMKDLNKVFTDSQTEDFTYLKKLR